MGYFFYNTDADSLVDPGRYPILIRRGIAVTSGPYRFGESLLKLSPSDILLMYENQVGVVAVGTVEEHWDRAIHRTSNYYLPGDKWNNQEYRIRVDWSLDLSEFPVGIDELRDQLGYTPRGTVTRIAKREAEVEHLIETRRAALGRA